MDLYFKLRVLFDYIIPGIIVGLFVIAYIVVIVKQIKINEKNEEEL